jgi:hypothetical protein
VVLVGEGRAGALGAGARRRGRGARPRGGGDGEARGRRDRRGEVAGADLPRAAPRPALGGRQDGRRHVRARRRRRSGGGGHGCRDRTGVEGGGEGGRDSPATASFEEDGEIREAQVNRGGPDLSEFYRRDDLR